jgi:hypothetical protein
MAPDLEVKRDIIQNAIDLVHALGIQSPKSGGGQPGAKPRYLA